MCGEMAADLEAVPILLGLGLVEFSASPSAIPALKRRISACTSAQTREIAAAGAHSPAPRRYVPSQPACFGRSKPSGLLCWDTKANPPMTQNETNRARPLKNSPSESSSFRAKNYSKRLCVAAYSG